MAVTFTGLLQFFEWRQESWEANLLYPRNKLVSEERECAYHHLKSYTDRKTWLQDKRGAKTSEVPFLDTATTWWQCSKEVSMLGRSLWYSVGDWTIATGLLTLIDVWHLTVCPEQQSLNDVGPCSAQRTEVLVIALGLYLAKDLLWMSSPDTGAPKILRLQFLSFFFIRVGS